MSISNPLYLLVFLSVGLVRWQNLCRKTLLISSILFVHFQRGIINGPNVSYFLYPVDKNVTWHRTSKFSKELVEAPHYLIEIEDKELNGIGEDLRSFIWFPPPQINVYGVIGGTQEWLIDSESHVLIAYEFRRCWTYSGNEALYCLDALPKINLWCLQDLNSWGESTTGLYSGSGT